MKIQLFNRRSLSLKEAMEGWNRDCERFYEDELLGKFWFLSAAMTEYAMPMRIVCSKQQVLRVVLQSLFGYDSPWCFVRDNNIRNVL